MSQHNDSIAEFSTLYERLLRSPGNLELLDHFRSHAKAVLGALGDEDLDAILAVDAAKEVPPEWLTRIYEALSDAEPFPALPGDERDAIFRENEREEETIGHAFKSALLAGLSPSLANLAVVFAAVPRISRKEQGHLRQGASVDAAWPECSALVACGLTPLSVFYATEAVYSFKKRLDRTELPEGVDLDFIKALPEHLQSSTTFSALVVGEFMRIARCGEQAACTLLNWLIAIAQLKPRVFANAYAQPCSRGVRLSFHPNSADSLFKRWGRPESRTISESSTVLQP
jgi:hypothetical protein